MTEYSGKARPFHEHKPAILIAGAPLVGKTRVAKKLGKITGLRSDPLRPISEELLVRCRRAEAVIGKVQVL